MTDAEWRAELARLNRMTAARREFAYDQADTARALERFGAPKPDARLQQIDAAIAELRQQQQTTSVATKLAALEEIRKEIV